MYAHILIYRTVFPHVAMYLTKTNDLLPLEQRYKAHMPYNFILPREVWSCYHGEKNFQDPFNDYETLSAPPP